MRGAFIFLFDLLGVLLLLVFLVLLFLFFFVSDIFFDDGWQFADLPSSAIRWSVHEIRVGFLRDARCDFSAELFEGEERRFL